MGRMACGCGHVMSDVQAPCPTTGQIAGDVFEEAALRDWVRTVASFLSALRDGRRLDWFKRHPRFVKCADLPDEDIVDDLLDAYRSGRRSAWECESCGRLWIQTRPYENEWLCFRPEPDDGYRGILAPDERAV